MLLIPHTQASGVTATMLKVKGCHPGYTLDESIGTCVCDLDSNIVLQCDAAKRYFYARVSSPKKCYREQKD